MKACSLSFALAMRPSRASTMSREENFFAARPAESSLSVRSWSCIVATVPFLSSPYALPDRAHLARSRSMSELEARGPEEHDTASIRCPSAGQIESGTGGKSAKVRCKPGDHLGHFLDLAEAVHRDLAQHVLDVLLGHLAEQLGLDHGRRHAVHQHAGGRQFLAQRLGESNDTGLGGGVGRGVGVAL